MSNFAKLSVLVTVVSILTCAGDAKTETIERSDLGADLRPFDSAATPTASDDGSMTVPECAKSPAKPTEPTGRPGPKVVVRSEDYNFGKMETYNSGQHKFVFANTGDQPLILKQGRSSCGCCTCDCRTQLPNGGKILSGKSAAVTLRWTIKRFTGAFRQTSTILTTDPDRPEVMLGVSGRITPTVRVVPWQLVFSRLSVGETATGEVRLYGYRSKPLKIGDCRISDPSSSRYFETAIAPLPADQVAAEPDARSGLLLRVTVKPGLKPGPFRREIVVGTNLDSAPSVEVPVKGTIDSGISVASPGWDRSSGVLKLPVVSSSEGARRRLILVVRGPYRKQVKFKPVRIVPEFVKVDLGQTTATNNGATILTTLTVRIPAGSPQGSYLGPPRGELGQIVIATNHPQEPQLRILLSFTVKD